MQNNVCFFLIAYCTVFLLASCPPIALAVLEDAGSRALGRTKNDHQILNHIQRNFSSNNNVEWLLKRLRNFHGMESFRRPKQRRRKILNSVLLVLEPNDTTLENNTTTIRKDDDSRGDAINDDDDNNDNARVGGGKGKSSQYKYGHSKSSKSSVKGTKQSSSSSKSSKESKSRSSGSKVTTKSICKYYKFTNQQRQRQLQFHDDNCSPNVIDVAKENPDLSVFVALVLQARLDNIFRCAGPFTLLIPNNNAFDDVDPIDFADLFLESNRQQLQELLLHHVLPGVTLSSRFQPGDVETLNGDTVNVEVNPVLFDDSTSIVNPDNLACNGVFHVIDEILRPRGDFCEDFDLEGDRENDNCEPNLLDVARTNSDLSTIVMLIEVAGLEIIFDCGGPFTLLLPTNDVLDDELVDTLVDPQNIEALQILLLYHVLPGRYSSSELEAGSIPTFLDGTAVTVEVDPIRFNSAPVVIADVEACNGLFHALDGVLAPEFPDFTSSPTLVDSFTSSPTMADTEEPTFSPTASEPTTSPTIFTCAEYDFGGGTATLNCSPNIFEVAEGILELTLFTSLIALAGLDDLFRCPGPFTANIPVNQALAVSIEDRLEYLVRPENRDELQDFLLYHILPGETASRNLSPGLSETLLSGESVLIGKNPLSFDNGIVTTADILTCNGLINILDAVLDPDIPVTSPPTTSPVQSPTESPTMAPTDLVTLSPTLSPGFIPTSSPTVAPGTVNVRLGAFLIAFVSPDTSPPSAEQYEAVVAATEAYYEEYLNQVYGNNPDVEFLGLSLDLNFTLKNAAIPEDRFNIYMEFSGADFMFESGPSIPTAEEIFDEIRQGITVEYILDYVRSVTGSPFEQTNEVFIAIIEDTTSASPSPTPPATAAPTSPISTRFDITLDLQMPESDQDVFRRAASRWESIITGDLPDIAKSDLDSPLADGCAYPDTVDDLYICGTLQTIDGAGEVVGLARPLFLRENGSDLGLPVVGEMIFDTEDLETVKALDLQDPLILHEMGHVLGFGIIWQDLGIAGPESENCPFTGPIATEEYNSITGCSQIPIEQEGGVETRCKHWSEECLRSELMTGELEFDSNPLSRLTIASMADLGYEVDYTNADDYGADDIQPVCFCNRRSREIWEGRHGEVFSLGENRTKKPQLDERKRQFAINVGMYFLNKSAKSRPPSSRVRNRKVRYVGDQAISVVMLDNGRLYGVIVVRKEHEKQ